MRLRIILRTGSLAAAGSLMRDTPSELVRCKTAGPSFNRSREVLPRGRLYRAAQIMWATDYPHPDRFFARAPQMIGNRTECF